MGNQVFSVKVFADSFPWGDTGGGEGGKKPCRACTDFKSWAKLTAERRGTGGQSEAASATEEGNGDEGEGQREDCPLDKDQLGRATWSLLHSMAAYFPDTPSPQQQKEMSAFLKILAKHYPCEHCAHDFQISMKASPPETGSGRALSQWLCRQHNEVNRKLGKPEFDCAQVDERWRDGWKDGSCDI